MAHMEPMDVDSISNDFDDKENLLHNSNVLSKTPSTEKGYEELDVSELNMKLRYSMTPATSPMSRSFTANCRDNKICDNENNLINTIFNDNLNLSHSFNSTITDSILKSPKLPLQVLPTEQFVDDNGNPINRSLDVECNNVTITVNGNENNDDNLSLPSTSSSLAHTPEATTPTKEIVKDGGSPIMRGLKSVLNMFRSPQNDVPSNDITTNDLNTTECQKKDDVSDFTTHLESTSATSYKNKEKISKTNSPLKDSLVFNEDLEKELLWKDETTILFKEEKIPVYKLFFPSTPVSLEGINSKPIEKENFKTTVNNIDGSYNENVNDYKDMTEVVKLSHLESETINSPESDSEFVDCETSYTKNDTRILDDHIPVSAPATNISLEFSITNENTFQLNEIVEAENSLPAVADIDTVNEINEIICDIHDDVKGADNDENFRETCYNDVPSMKGSLKKDISNDRSDKDNTLVCENVSESLIFKLEKYSETIDSQLEKQDKNDIVNKSVIVVNNASLCEKVKDDDVKGFYPSQIPKEIEKHDSGELECNFDSPIVLNGTLTLETQTDVFTINNIEQSLDSQVVNELNIDLDAVQDPIITMGQNCPLVECEKVLNVNNNCNVKVDSEIFENTILKEKHNNEMDTSSDQVIQLESKEIKTVNSNLPSDIPLPYDSDIDKEILQDLIDKSLRESDKSVNILSNNLDFDSSYSTEPIKQSVNEMTSLTERHSETISYPLESNIVANPSIIQTSQLELSEYISNIKNNKTEMNDTDSCIPTIIADTKEISDKIVDSAIFPLNKNCPVNENDLEVLTLHTQNNQNLYLQNHDEFVKTSKSTDVEDESLSRIDVDDVRLSLTNKTLVTETELHVLRHDSEDSENLFETKNKLASLEVQCCDSVIGEKKSGDVNETVVKNDEIDITKVNINTSVIEMELDEPTQDSEKGANQIEFGNTLTTSLEFPGCDNNVVGKVGSDDKIKEVSVPSTLDNSLVTEMEQDVSMPVLEDSRNVIDVEKQLKSLSEERGRESVIEDINAEQHFGHTSLEEKTTANDFIVNEVRSTYSNQSVIEMELDVSKPNLEDSRHPIDTKYQLKSPFKGLGCKSDTENVNSKKYFENICLNDYEEITSGNDYKNNEVMSIPSKSNNSLTKMEIDVSEHDLITSENLIKASCGDRDTEDFEIVKNNFKNILTLPDERVETISGVTTNDELIFPFTTKVSSEIDLGVCENVENTFVTKDFTPSSPHISSNLTQVCFSINCGEVDDVTTYSNSPTSQTNRTELLYDQKTYNGAKKSTNASFDCNLQDNITADSYKENRMNHELYVKDSEKLDYIKNNISTTLSTPDKLQDDIECNMPQNRSLLEKTEFFVEDAEINLSNKISSSSSEIYKSKNVFNLPEINDMNFNPFETTSKVDDNQRTSSNVCFNPLEQTNIKSDRTKDKNSTQDLERNLSPNLSNVTSSSKTTDDITSHREVHTEDEDTIEGPFLEADDFSDIEKVADYESKKDMINFEVLPTRTNDDNENGELFIDAEAFEFLLNQNKSNVVADSGKESLFLKFDPLFAKRISSDGVLAALNKIQKRQSTPKKPTALKIMDKDYPTPGPSTTTPIGLAVPVAKDIAEEPVAALSKPMMVVNPAIASTVSPRKSTTPARDNRRSLTFTSPAMAVIDRLLSLSGNSSSLDQDSSLPPSREHNETDFALTQLRELLAEKEIHVHNLRSESKELKERFAILESQVRTLEAESEERLRKVKELNEHLAEKNKVNKSMAIVVEEYERTIASLIAEMEQEKKQNAEERMKLISERDEQTAHLSSMEVSFSDLHSKYEKSKQIILSMKANEDTYKKSLNEFEVNILKMQTNYDLLKQHATSKLNHANQELEKYNRAHDAEVLKLNAMIKRKDLHITSLEESLSQKTKANEELTAICDELINKVG